jgi:hypothetical protein
MYAGARRALVGNTSLNLGMQRERAETPLFLPFAAAGTLLDLSDEERQDANALISHIVHGLVREELIEDNFLYGSGTHLRTEGGGPFEFGDSGGLIYRITALGVELFTAAHGMRGHPGRQFLDPENEFAIESPILLPPELGLLSALPYVETQS